MKDLAWYSSRLCNLAWCPIAFNNWASLQNIIVDSQTGFVIKRNDIENYCTKLSTLMSDNDLRSNIASKAIAHISQFDCNTVGEEWLKLFKTLQCDLFKK